MKQYKKLLLRKLTDSGWELLERCDGMQWWLDESWRIRSVKQHWGFELLILFLVDPMYCRAGSACLGCKRCRKDA